LKAAATARPSGKKGFSPIDGLAVLFLFHPVKGWFTKICAQIWLMIPAQPYQPAIARKRLFLLALIPIMGTMLVSGRLVMLKTVSGEKYRAIAERQHHRVAVFNPSRGTIFDRRGHPLAASVETETLYMRPDLLFPPTTELAVGADILTSVARSLRMSDEELFSIIDTPTTRMVTVARNLSPQQASQVRSVLLTYTRTRRNGVGMVDKRGWWFETQTVRGYPKGEFAPHVLGYTLPDRLGDTLGQEGIERAMSTVLNGERSTATVRQTALGTVLSPVDREVIERTHGKSLVLTLEESVQMAADRALAEKVQEFRAKSGTAVAVDVRTGALLAVSNYPSYDINSRVGTTDHQRRNRAVTDTVEPGSVMKTFTTLAAMELGQVSINSMIDCQGGTLVLPRRTIRDSGRKMGTVSLLEVFKESSNVGSYKAIRNVSHDAMFRALNAMGFGQPTNSGLPGEVRGTLRPASRWSQLTLSSLAQGYEITATPLQIAMAGAAIGNRGRLMKPYVISEVLDHRGQVTTRTLPTVRAQIASERVARDMLKMMEAVVSDGTGKAAQLDGWIAAGKTGTTKLLDPKTRTYTNNRYMASFLGLAPADDPRVAVYVTVVDPDPSFGYYGGRVAAPVFKPIAEAALMAMRVPTTPGMGPSRESREEVRQRLLNQISQQIPRQDLDRFLSPPTTSTIALHSPEASQGPLVMPDLRGLSLRDALSILAEWGLETQVEGSGVIAEHWPRPHQDINGQTPVQLRLTPLTTGMKSLAQTINPTPPRALTSIDDPAENPSLRINKGQQTFSIDLFSSRSTQPRLTPSQTRP
jgi:cell division protein FtsI (penicillin-binding protein 3)